MKKIIVAMLTVLTLYALFVLYLERPERTQVIVVGAGASGVSAAIEAKQEGYSVVLLEKMPRIGGNSLWSTSGINAVNSRIQIEMGSKDTMELFYEDTVSAGHYENNQELVKILIEESGEAVNWLLDMGADLTEIGRTGGSRIARGHRPSGGAPVGAEIMHVLEDQIDRLDIDLRVENKVIELLYDDRMNRVNGVLVRNREGREYEIMADAVVIATGGFGGSPERFVSYNPRLKGYHSTNHAGATGDYIDLVANLPVDLVDMSKIQTHPTVEPSFGVMIASAVRGNGGILLNEKGERFVNEIAFRDVLSKAILNQPDGRAILIFDDSIRRGLESAEGYIKKGLVKEFDSVEALATWMNIEEQVIIHTIERYNGFVAGGADLDFERQSTPVQLTAPYYAIPVEIGVHYCMGGLPINEYAQVMGISGEPIAGLYACGEATGGIHGNNRLGGNSLTDAIVFGRIAGQSAVGVNP